MSKYIDAGKLKYEIERRNLSERYITTERYEEELYEIIDSLEEEQEIWKPSEELIGCLERLIAFKNQEPEDIKGCESLLEQLKKLIV